MITSCVDRGGFDYGDVMMIVMMTSLIGDGVVV